MGATGPGIFSDDLAMDLRAEFREMIADGVSPEEATGRLVASYGKSGPVDYDDDDPVFWTALAAVQWTCGRLLDSVKRKAIEVIDHGADLRRWAEDAGPKDVAKRKAVLERLRAQLLSPQPAPKQIKKEFRDRTDWEVGHAIAYRLCSGKWVVMRVVAIDDNKDRIAIVDLCDWVGDEPPPPAIVPGLPRRRTPSFERKLDSLKDLILPHTGPAVNDRQAAATTTFREAVRNNLIDSDGKFSVYRYGPRDFPTDRVRLIGTGLPVTPSNPGSGGATYFGGWKHLDRYLNDTFGLK